MQASAAPAKPEPRRMAAVTRTASYVYDAQGLVQTETRQGGEALLKLTTTYGRAGNESGLVNKVTQQWYDPASGAMQSRVVSEVDYDDKRRFPA